MKTFLALLIVFFASSVWSQAIYIGDTSGATALSVGRGNGSSYVRGTFTTPGGAAFVCDSFKLYAYNAGDGNDDVCVSVHTDSSANPWTKVAFDTVQVTGGAGWFKGKNGVGVVSLNPSTSYWLAFGCATNFTGYYNSSVTKNKNDLGVACPPNPWTVGTITSGNAFILALWGHQSGRVVTVKLGDGVKVGKADLGGHRP